MVVRSFNVDNSLFTSWRGEVQEEGTEKRG